MKQQSLSIIIPCYNEESVLNELYKRIKNVINNLKTSTSVIFINDGSSDKTFEILHGFSQENSNVKIISFSRNFGHQIAVTAGINACNSDFAIIIDADLQDPPELIPELLNIAIKEKANVVYCVRKSRKKETWFKKWSAKIFYKIINLLSDTNFPLNTGDFRLIDRKIMNEFNRFREKRKYIRGLISWVGFKQIPFYYHRDARYAGKTKYPLLKMIQFAKNALLYFSSKPLNLSIWIGTIAVLMGVFYALWIVVNKMFDMTYTVAGWSSIIVIIVFLGGVQLLSIGVLGNYIGILFNEIKNRPEYIIDKKINF